MHPAECGGSASGEPRAAGVRRTTWTAAVVVALPTCPSSRGQTQPSGAPCSSSASESPTGAFAHPISRIVCTDRCALGEDSSASANVCGAYEAARCRSPPDRRRHSVGDWHWLLLARGPRALWPVVERRRTLLSLVQRGEMDSHLAGLAGARGSYFLLSLSFLSVTVVLGVVTRKR
jgi:hypothetical protein